MDRPLKEQNKNLAQNPWLAVLGLFNELESLVRQSLIPNPQTQKATEVSVTVAASATAPTAESSRAEPLFETRRPEYKPALSDQSIIQALLAFHRSHQEASVSASVSEFSSSNRNLPRVEVSPKKSRSALGQPTVFHSAPLEKR